MEHSNKVKITADLTKYVKRMGSQNKAANSMPNVSGSTISQMLNEKWELISDEMWRNVAAHLYDTATVDSAWQSVETKTYLDLTELLVDAQTYSMSMGIVAPAGSGKSATMKTYVANAKNAYLLRCNEYWNRKFFLGELLTVMGFDYSGLTVGEMMHEVVKRIKSKELPIIILDEADKLTDQVLYFFITLYNALEDQCGIILCATDHLRKRLDRGRRLNKKGYNEIYSRIGRKFIELPEVAASDVHQICMANGITDQKDIRSVWDDCEGDLRRVKRKIHALKQQHLNGN